MGLRTFTFGGTSSSSYNMFITEAASYDAPERAVEMLEIPGRNGHLALDQGRFENVEVTYHVCVYGSSHSAFQTTLADVRSWLCGKIGYQRLTDDYNPNEYRMAIYKSGIDVDDAYLNGAEFDIVFDCKPQRFLTSGETETAVADGGTLSNPTQFDSSPLLNVYGYGNISFNNYSIDVLNQIGGIVVADNDSYYLGETYSFDPTLVNVGDEIRIKARFNGTANAYATSSSETLTMTSQSKTADSDAAYTTQAPNFTRTTISGKSGFTSPFITSFEASFPVGTDANYIDQVEMSITGTGSNIGSFTVTFSLYMCVRYTETNSMIYVYINQFDGVSTLGGVTWSTEHIFDGVSIVIDSSKAADAYIDCDTGECYTTGTGGIVSLNDKVALGSDLPTLAPGTNTITYDNTITSLKVTPRWWRV